VDRLRCLIFLASSIPSFRITDDLVADFARRCPSCAFQRVRDRDELLSALPQADLFITWKMKAEWYEQAPRLRAVLTPAAGRERIAPHPRGLVRLVHGTFHGPIMAQTLLGMILHFNRCLHQAVHQQLDHRWEPSAFESAALMGNQHIVIVGYGSIGRACGRLLKAAGCGRITGVRRSLSRTDLDSDADQILSVNNLPGVLPDADHVVAILPGGPETHGIVTAEHFSMMKPSAYFYNVGRGNCCDEGVLVNALKNNMIAGAGLDVFATEPLPTESPLWDLPNVLILPHASAMGPDYLRLYVAEAAAAINKINVDC